MAAPNAIDAARPYDLFVRPRPPTLGSTPREGANLTYPNRYAQPWQTESIYVFQDNLDADGLAQALKSPDGRVVGAAVVTVDLDGAQLGYASEQTYIATVLRQFYPEVNAVAQLQILGSGCAWSRATSG